MVVVDANLRLSAVDDAEAYRANVMAALQHAHLIKVSDDDLEALAVPGTTALERAHYLQQQTQAQWLALTLGPDGAWLLQRDGLAVHAAKMRRSRWWTPVGAGDCFLAGLITALLAGPERGRSAGPARGGMTAPDHGSPAARRAAPRAGECQPLCGAGGLHATRYEEVRERLALRRSATPQAGSLTRRAWRPVCRPGCGDGQQGLARWCLLPLRQSPRAQRRRLGMHRFTRILPARAPRARAWRPCGCWRQTLRCLHCRHGCGEG